MKITAFRYCKIEQSFVVFAMITHYLQSIPFLLLYHWSKRHCYNIMTEHRKLTHHTPLYLDHTWPEVWVWPKGRHEINRWSQWGNLHIAPKVVPGGDVCRWVCEMRAGHGSRTRVWKRSASQSCGRRGEARCWI